MSSVKVFALVSLKTKAGKGCVLIYKETSSLRKGQELAGKDFFLAKYWNVKIHLSCQKVDAEQRVLNTLHTPQKSYLVKLKSSPAIQQESFYQ